MKVLSIGSDRKLFEEGSPVSIRQAEYGACMDELHIIVFSLKSLGFDVTPIAPNVTVYPTNSLSRLMYVFDAIRLGKRIVQTRSFQKATDVITCQDPFEAGFVGWCIARMTRLSLHLQIHTDFLNPHFKGGILQSIRRLLVKFLLPRADGIRVVSQHIADSIENAHIPLRAKPQVLPVRIDVPELENMQLKGPSLAELVPLATFRILMASRLTPEKNIGDAIRALAIVVKKYPNTVLYIAGTGPEKQNLEKMVQELHLISNVVFLGWRSDTYVLMKSANIFLSTSRFEGYGMSIIEAGLAGCPVVSTQVGIVGEILVNERNSYICPVGDILCLSSSIITLIEHNPERLLMAGYLAKDIGEIMIRKEQYIEQYIQGLEETTHTK